LEENSQNSFDVLEENSHKQHVFLLMCSSLQFRYRLQPLTQVRVPKRRVQLVYISLFQYFIFRRASGHRKRRLFLITWYSGYAQYALSISIFKTFNFLRNPNIHAIDLIQDILRVARTPCNQKRFPLSVTSRAAEYETLESTNVNQLNPTFWYSNLRQGL